MIDYSKIKLTAEEKKILKANKSHLTTAYKSSYTLPVYQRDLIAMNDIYMKYINKSGVNVTCPRCVLKMLVKLYPIAEAQNLL